jgi:Zn-finger nucleic acid-binding protein
MKRIDALRCPDCALPLIERKIGVHSLHPCSSCRGLWIDRDEALALSATIRHGASFAAPTKREKPLRVRHCSRCDGVSMSVLRYRGIEIDLCPTCKGIWLDADEIAPIMARHGLKKGDRRKPLSVTLDDPPRLSNLDVVLDAAHLASNIPPDVPFHLLEGLGEMASVGAESAAEAGGALIELLAGIVSS